jgi:hypothetical protein
MDECSGSIAQTLDDRAGAKRNDQARGNHLAIYRSAFAQGRLLEYGSPAVFPDGICNGLTIGIKSQRQTSLEKFDILVDSMVCPLQYRTK